MSLYLNCNEIPELNNIKAEIELNDNIPDLLQNIFTNTQRIRGDRIECRILASIYKCILTENDVFTTSTPTDISVLEDLKENQVANLYLLPINPDIEYHFITICRVGDNYIIYSVNGRVYIPRFSVNIAQFDTWYKELIQRNKDKMVYKENINDLEIAKAWYGITHDDLQTSLHNSIAQRHDNEDYEEDEEDENEEVKEWEHWVKLYLSKDLTYYNPKILIFTRNEQTSSVGG